MLRYPIFYGICLLALFSGFTLRAQEAPADGSADRSWTLHDCMAYAVANTPRAKIQELQNDNAAKDYRTAILGMLPSVSGSVGTSNNFGRSVSPETNTYENSSSFSNSYGLSGAMPIFNGFSVVNNVKITRIAKIQGTESSQMITDQIALATMQAYSNAHYYRGLVAMATEQLNESKQTLHRTTVQEELGLKGNADVLQVEADVAARTNNLIRQENAYLNAMLTLKEVMFYPPGETLQLDTTEQWAVAPLAGKESADSIYRTAVDLLPEARIAELDFQSAKINYRTAKWKLLPSLSVGGGISTGYSKTLGENATKVDPFGTQFKNRAGEYFSVSLSIPIFSSFTRQTNIVKQRNEMRIAEQRQNQTLREIESAILGAVQDMEGSAKEYVQCVRQVIAQESAYTAMRRKYEEGIASVIDLQTTANQLLSAKSGKLNALLEYMIKRSVVAYYKGTPYLAQQY